MTKRILPTAFAIASGAIVLLAYLYPHPVLALIRTYLVRWAVIIAAFAFILGFFNILRVHLLQVVRARKNAVYSAILVLSALVSLALTLMGLIARSLQVSPVMEIIITASDWWFQNVLLSLQASAGGLIAFALLLSAVRLLRTRKSWWSAWFLVSAMVVLLGTLPLPGPIGVQLAQFRQDIWLNTLAMAGVRGLLIGVGLGTLVMGLRVIIGLDRPHSSA
ncbi:MAG: hypothetical protein JW900_08555 [Anaerolineae bacterium]|nr:hypothetical protein [Anaerolineae bacterium]